MSTQGRRRGGTTRGPGYSQGVKNVIERRAKSDDESEEPNTAERVLVGDLRNLSSNLWTRQSPPAPAPQAAAAPSSQSWRERYPKCGWGIMIAGMVICIVIFVTVYSQYEQPNSKNKTAEHGTTPNLHSRSTIQYPLYGDVVIFPTLNEIRSSIRRAGLVGNNTIFVHGAAGSRDEAEFSLQFAPAGGYIQHCLDEHDREQWIEFNKRPWNTLYWQRVAQAMAEESWGTVYLLHPENHPLVASPNTEASNVPLFPENSLPYIRRNERIQSLVYVRYNEVFQDVRTAARDVIWTKGTPFPLLQDFNTLGESMVQIGWYNL